MIITKIQIPSTNFDTTSKPKRLLVIHWIVGNLAAADAVFKKQDGGTSAHYAVEDNNVHQYVEEKYTAYHAGVYSVNQESIGIEHSAAPDRPASEATYQTSGKLIAEIAKRWNIPLDRQHIIKHSEVKATQCPGSMDLDKLISIAKAQSIVLPLPNPGYAPTFAGQTVGKDGITYQSYSEGGQLLWRILPPSPDVDYKAKFEALDIEYQTYKTSSTNEINGLKERLSKIKALAS